MDPNYWNQQYRQLTPAQQNTPRSFDISANVLDQAAALAGITPPTATGRSILSLYYALKFEYHGYNMNLNIFSNLKNKQIQLLTSASQDCKLSLHVLHVTCTFNCCRTYTVAGTQTNTQIQYQNPRYMVN